MNNTLESAIKTLTKKAENPATSTHEAMQLTQAALNMAHVQAVLQQTRAATTPTQQPAE
jgi:ribosomal protein S20